MMEKYFLDEVIGKRKKFDKEYRTIRQDTGEVRWVHGLAELEADAEGGSHIYARYDSRYYRSEKARTRKTRE
jgi:hypothetical protein